MEKKTLYLFTASFPFSKGETFIETEIKYLSEAFKNIYIVPLFAYDTDNVRNVPENCRVLNPIIRNRWQHYFLGLFGLKTLKLYFFDLISNKVYKNKHWLKDLLADFCTTNNIFQSKPLSRLLTTATANDIFYFYWGKGLANMLPFIPKVKAKKIVRFHGGDLYDSNYGGYIPIHQRIMESLDLSVFISKHGQNYLVSRYPNISINSVVSYLGSEDFGISKRSDDGIFRLLSCSNVISIKRVHLIFETIQYISDFPVEWTHIGDGPDFGLLQEKARYSRDNVKINLLGRLSNKEVIDFYKNNYVDAFINVSSTEGLPVSIMEAISFNIPVIGTNVGGTSEIVCSETGILLKENPICNEILMAIEQLRDSHYEPRLFWKKNFSAIKNYKNFIKTIVE